MSKQKRKTHIKKIMTMLLILACLLSSCKGTDNNEPQQNPSDQSDVLADATNLEQESTQESTEPEQESEEGLIGDQSENENYKDLSVRSIKNYKNVSFLIDSTPDIFSIKASDEWDFKKANDSSYTINRGGAVIGNVLTGEATDLNMWQIVDSKQKANADFDVMQHIEKYGSGKSLKFRYRYCVTSTDTEGDMLTLTIDYTELSRSAASAILKQSTFAPVSTELSIGVVPEAKDGSILIIGNSFIGSSDIEEILKEMLQRNQKNVQVTAISRGMATVDTYSSDTILMSEIRNGNYDAVFVCGLYTSDEINNLGKIKEVCDKANVKLVIFPAHNEAQTVITGATKKFGDLVIVNWKADIENLISNGRDTWDFCVDDYHKHSTPLAGYVGAHMIYRAIFGELPTADMKTTLSQREIDSILGDYVETGCAKGTLYTLK